MPTDGEKRNIYIVFQMEITLYISNQCAVCKRVKDKLESLTEEEPGLLLAVKNIDEIKDIKSFIVPALFLDNKLYSYGDVNIEKLKSFIYKKS